jgi:hypothetical protein
MGPGDKGRKPLPAWTAGVTGALPAALTKRAPRGTARVGKRKSATGESNVRLAYARGSVQRASSCSWDLAGRIGGRATGSKNYLGVATGRLAAISHTLRSKKRSHECERCTHECVRHNGPGVPDRCDGPNGGVRRGYETEFIPVEFRKDSWMHSTSFAAVYGFWMNPATTPQPSSSRVPSSLYPLDITMGTPG